MNDRTTNCPICGAVMTLGEAGVACEKMHGPVYPLWGDRWKVKGDLKAAAVMTLPEARLNHDVRAVSVCWPWVNTWIYEIAGHAGYYRETAVGRPGVVRARCKNYHGWKEIALCPWLFGSAFTEEKESDGHKNGD